MKSKKLISIYIPCLIGQSFRVALSSYFRNEVAETEIVVNVFRVFSLFSQECTNGKDGTSYC